MKKDKKENNEIQEQNMRLSNITHEIRTPMNAIVGLSELLLNRSKDNEQREYLNAIQVASRNLLVVINNLIDYEQMKSGEFVIAKEPFSFEETITDVLEMVRINVNDKKFRFLLDTNVNYPGMVVGDGIKLKQLLMHLITNATKYTDEGYVVLGVRAFGENGKAKIKIWVEDTGVGMSKEKVDAIYEPFSQATDLFEKQVGGLGIGLSIARKYMLHIGSDFIIESKEGEGTKVSFEIETDETSETKGVYVKNCQDMHIALFFKDNRERELLEQNLYELNVTYEAITGLGDLFARQGKKDFTHIVCDYENYLKIKDISELGELDLKKIVTIGYYAEIPRDSDVLFIRTPVFFRDMAEALNGDIVSGLVSTLAMRKDDTLSFTIPGARILVVDDNAINLRVTAGLLSEYDITVDCANSGEEAIRLIRRTKYDLVFMDHMMPGMDGMEVTKIIRDSHDAYFLSLPIIALTANTINGVEEMFKEAGMNDFLPKPVTTAELEEMLKKWIPKEKFKEGRKEKTGSFEKIDEALKNLKYINIEQGLSYTGGNFDMYRTVLKEFAGNINNKKSLIEKLCDQEDISKYTIEVHSLKSVSKTVGAMEISKLAQELERMGHVRDIAGIKSKNPKLIHEIELVENDLEEFAYADKSHVKKVPMNRETARLKLKEMYYALDDFQYDVAEEVVYKLGSYEMEEDVEAIFDKLSDAVKNVDYAGAKEAALEMLTYL